VREQSNSLSLYRRWRPQRFADIVGQEEIVRTLRNAVDADETAHAYLFAGERGIGKTSVARILARAVNCLKVEAGEPCNECANCSTILASRSLDIVEIDGASNRGIDHIRRLREEVNFTPTDLKRKVYIIDEVHMLTNEAFNALLKTLEEPPSHAMFIFATTEPHKVPRTIISRCQAFEFRRIPADKIAGLLVRVANAEKVEVTEEALDLIARRANGGMRDALVMLEQSMSFGGEKITAPAILDMLGLVPRETQQAFLDAILIGDRPAMMTIVDTLAERGKDLDVFLTDIVHLIRERLVEGTHDLPTEIEIAKRLLEIKSDLFRSLDRQIRLEIGLLHLMEALSPHAASRASSIRSKEPALHTEKSPPVPSAEPELFVGASIQEPESPSSLPGDGRAAAQTAAPPSNWEEQWKRMLREIEQDRIAIAAFLTEGQPTLEGTELLISFHPEYSFHKESLQKRENMQYLAGVVHRHFGDSVHVDVKIDERVERNPLPHEVLHEKARLVCRAFDGKIVKEEL